MLLKNRIILFYRRIELSKIYDKDIILQKNRIK